MTTGDSIVNDEELPDPSKIAAKIGPFNDTKSIILISIKSIIVCYHASVMYGTKVFFFFLMYFLINFSVWESGSGGEHRTAAPVHSVHSAPGTVISQILGKFQAGKGGGIFHAGAAVPARLTPPRLRSAAGGAAAPGCCKPASRKLRSAGEVPEVSDITPSQ